MDKNKIFDNMAPSDVVGFTSITLNDAYAYMQKNYDKFKDLVKKAKLKRTEIDMYRLIKDAIEIEDFRMIFDWVLPNTNSAKFKTMMANVWQDGVENLTEKAVNNMVECCKSTKTKKLLRSNAYYGSPTISGEICIMTYGHTLGLDRLAGSNDIHPLMHILLSSQNTKIVNTVLENIDHIHNATNVVLLYVGDMYTNVKSGSVPMETHLTILKKLTADYTKNIRIVPYYTSHGITDFQRNIIVALINIGALSDENMKLLSPFAKHLIAPSQTCDINLSEDMSAKFAVLAI